jgi:serine/threonine protein phosphatase PrpC
MEDAVCCKFFEQQGKSYCLLMVCDGHGDRGLVSQFVCDTLPDILQNNMKDEEATWETKWQRSCLEVDSQLKETNIIGGSTAVMALISEGSIVVANVGDSRAILVQSSSSSSTTRLETNKEQLTVSPTKEENTKEGEEKPSTNNTPIVVAMSEDHKPNLERELTRIVNAGMTMREIIFEENGEEFTIHKIAKNDKEQLAVSRSFGDFEYKLNTTLAPEEQAVTAVPDVRIHVRDSATDMYLILACDGVFDVMKNEQVMKFCLDQVSMRCEMSTDTVLPEVGDSLLRECLNCGSKDNMTTIIAALGNESTKIKPVIQGRTLFNE